MKLTSKVSCVLILSFCCYTVCACNSNGSSNITSNEDQYSQTIIDDSVETKVINSNSQIKTDTGTEASLYKTDTSGLESETKNIGWKNAYLELIENNQEQYDISYFNSALIDINNDNVPELYLADTVNQIVGGIYSYNSVDNNVVNILSVGNRQSLYGYIPQESHVFTYATWLGDEIISEYEYNNSTLSKTHTFSYISSKDEYMIDDKIISKECYIENLNELTSKMSMVDLLDIDEIKNILE